MVNTLLRVFGKLFVSYLSQPSRSYIPPTTNNPELLASTIQPGDVLLVEGFQRYSTAIKYLTQSTWSHSALFVGDFIGKKNEKGEMLNLIEADLKNDVIAVPLSKFHLFHTRICRPVELTKDDLHKLLSQAMNMIGYQYDLKNVIDLLRYFMPTPPIPTKWRRNLLMIGSGEPTKAICSTMIAQCFQNIGYPILPIRVTERNKRIENYLIRHHSLYTPRDFDLSPYFEVIKPTIRHGFNYKNIRLKVIA